MASSSPPFTLHLFSTLDTSQSSHGIPHADYARYHRYCTARLHRLRHARDVRPMLVHSHRHVEGKSGRRDQYCPRELPAVIEHANVVWTLVYQAERAWALASALSGQNHAYALRRWHKAAHWAKRLVEVAEQCCNETSVQECRSYATWCDGHVALERRDYRLAFQCYRSSMEILLTLALSIPENATPEELARGDVWTTRAETLLRPLVRFTGHEAKDELTAEDWAATAPATTASGTTKKSTLDAIVVRFGGHEIPLDGYPKLAVLYLKLEPLLAQALTEEQSMQLSADLDDAKALVNGELGHYATLPAGPAVDAKREELTTLAAFFEYHKLHVWRQQQEGRVEDMDDGDVVEIVHLYDSLLQNAQAMTNLLASDKHEEDPFWLEAQAHVLRIRALRCYHVARLYESELGGPPAQVAALARQADKLTKRAMEEIAACDSMEEADRYLEALDSLAMKIKALQCRTEATRYLASQGSVTSGKTDRPLWLRLDDLDAGEVLADNPPLLLPVPYKPVFYDLAWQHLNADIPLEGIQAYITDNEPKKTGLFSWFSSK